MKLLHLSDLHLGKRFNEFSLIEAQRYILGEILKIAEQEQPDGVLIAGDIYDRTLPSAEAVAMLDEFLVGLSQQGCQVYIISGNHDSPERIAFGGRLMEGSGVHLAPVYDGHTDPLTLTDAYGPVRLYLLPFLKPAHVRRFFPEQEIESYTDALAAAVGEMNVDPSLRNVLVTHQFVTGASRCESEEVSIGGADQVDGSVFDAFDYVALGHIHNPQRVGRETMRYCGTPLKYSFSEAGHPKSVTIVELEEKGTTAVRTVPLIPLRDMAELRGSYEELTFRGFYEGTDYRKNYVHITLTDEDDIPDAVRKLRVIYPYLAKLDYDNTRTRTETVLDEAEDIRQLSPLALLEQFFAQQNGQPMGEDQRAFAKDLIETIWEDERCGR